MLDESTIKSCESIVSILVKSKLELFIQNSPYDKLCVVFGVGMGFCIIKGLKYAGTEGQIFYGFANAMNT